MTFPLIVYHFQFIGVKELRDEQVALCPMRRLSASAVRTEKFFNPSEEKIIADSLYTFQVGGNGQGLPD